MASTQVAHAGIGVVKIKCGDTASLISAVANARLAPEIDLNVDNVQGCTYTLTSPYGAFDDGLPPLTTVAIINGNGSTIARSSTSLFRILEVSLTGNLTLRNTKITGGDTCGGDVADGCGGHREDGGGIFNLGMLTLSDSEVSGNRSSSRGGGIYSTAAHSLDASGIGPGAVRMNNTKVAGNFALLYGGGLYNSGTMELTNSRVVDNSAVFFGGGISNFFELTMINSMVKGNSATSATNVAPQTPQGGGIWTSFAMSLDKTTVSGNTALYNGGGEGGGIYASPSALSQVTLIDSSVNGNASDHGGGIYLLDPGSVLSMVRGSVQNNSASIDGGGIYNNGASATAIGVVFSGNTPNNCAPPDSVSGCSG